MHSLQRKVLRTICPDQKGLIARITNICYKHELNIVQNNEFVDHRTGRFFMRTELEGIFNDSVLWLTSTARCRKVRFVSSTQQAAAVSSFW